MDIEFQGRKIYSDQELPFSIVKNAPSILVPGTFPNYYTLIIVDMDYPVPSNPFQSPFINWMVMNIFGNKLSSGVEQLSYYPPNPPANLGMHRYNIYFYRQEKGKILNDLNNEGINENRKSFNLEKYVKENLLTLVCKSSFRVSK